VYPGYVPDPDAPPDDAPPVPENEPILVLEFAVHDSTGQPVADRQTIPNGDLRNSSSAAPAESANPGGMTSSSAAYAVYNVANEGLAAKPHADGYAMNTVNGYVYFADAGSPLEQALATKDTFAVFARVKRLTDSGQFEFIVGRPEGAMPEGLWTIGVDVNDGIVVAMGNATFDTGVTFGVGQWHEVGLSYTGDGSGGDWVYIYVDGKREGAFQPSALASDQVFYLGSGLGGANRFRGLFDHVEFWDEPVDETTFAELSNVAPWNLAGDYTGNGTVDAADYIIWRKASGQLVAPGTGADGTGNGLVDADDYALWRANFGRIAAPPAAALAESAVRFDADSTREAEPPTGQTALVEPSTSLGGKLAFAFIDTLARDQFSSHVGRTAPVRFPAPHAAIRDTLLLSLVSREARSVEVTNPDLGATARDSAHDADNSNARTNLFTNPIADELARELALQIACTTRTKR
jgi:Concanavalin A-like lectin/glucanases superfamily